MTNCRTKIIIPVIALIALATNFAFAQKATEGPTADPERARELIDASRAALGLKSTESDVQSIHARGKLKRLIRYVSVQSPKVVEDKEKELPGRIEIEYLFPDKFRRKVSGRALNGEGYSFTQIVNGSRAWRNPPLRAVSSNKDRRVIDVEDFERSKEFQARGSRQQMAFYALGWFLKDLPSFPLKYSYAGQLMTYSGLAEVIIAQGPDGFQFSILLDPQSKMPIALATVFVQAREPAVLIDSPRFFDRRTYIGTVQRARQERQARRKPVMRYEMHFRFSDYRAVAGFLLPHTITTAINDEVVEVYRFDHIEINRPINLRKFEIKPEAE